jgi:hypothetical protein
MNFQWLAGWFDKFDWGLEQAFGSVPSAALNATLLWLPARERKLRGCLRIWKELLRRSEDSGVPGFVMKWPSCLKGVGDLIAGAIAEAAISGNVARIGRLMELMIANIRPGILRSCTAEKM